jgi:hypothetical protein
MTAMAVTLAAAERAVLECSLGGQSMAKVRTSSARQRGNPNWGKPPCSGAVMPTLTEFEQTVRKFKLKPEEYVNSELLRKWAERNVNSKYIPESLLKAWKLGVYVSL